MSIKKQKLVAKSTHRQPGATISKYTPNFHSLNNLKTSRQIIKTDLRESETL